MKYKIEKGIELPARAGKKKCELKIALESMDVGDCILNIEINRQVLNAHCFDVRKTLGYKFAIRKQTINTFGAWRIE